MNLIPFEVLFFALSFAPPQYMSVSCFVSSLQNICINSLSKSLVRRTSLVPELICRKFFLVSVAVRNFKDVLLYLLITTWSREGLVVMGGLC
jgi:hypothetical protein